jgi:hypothetical protein
VLHSIHPQPVRHLPGPVHPHQGPTEVTTGSVITCGRNWLWSYKGRPRDTDFTRKSG